VADTGGLKRSMVRDVTVDSPAPVFDGEVLVSPATILLGEPVTVSAAVRNDGAASVDGAICVSFRQLTDPEDSLRVTSSSAGDEPGHQIHASGTSIPHRECIMTTARHLLAEYRDNDWSPGETNAYELTVTPRAAGTLEILVRAALQIGSDPCARVNVMPSNGTRDTDQQGWAAKRFVVRVFEEPPLPGMIRIASGTFTMGSPEDELGHGGMESPLHEVTISRSFDLGEHEVTQAEWQTVMGWNESSDDGDDKPVEQVTWYDCIDYCNKRSLAEELTAAYTITPTSHDGVHIIAADVAWDQGADGYRLPTESEWEYSCRAGTTTAFYSGPITEGFCNDPNLDLVGWYCGNSGNVTHDVGGKPANAWSLRDMHGNALEWCWDWWASYPTGPVTDPTGPASGTDKPARGGGCRNVTRDSRSASRMHDHPDFRDGSHGMRVARTPR
jgi:formylglycine-generating enzyme required for sulfatase activity